MILGVRSCDHHYKTLHQKKEASSQRKEPSSTPTQEKWGVEILLK
jgi:hypothetical protein